MKKGTAAAVVALAMMAMPDAHAGWVDGNRLREACEARPGTFSEGICVGYIFGTADMLFDMTSHCAGSDKPPPFAAPSLAFCA